MSYLIKKKIGKVVMSLLGSWKEWYDNRHLLIAGNPSIQVGKEVVYEGR